VRYRVAYSTRALAQLEALYLYIADAAGPERAMAFVSSITDYCDGLKTFPLRGTLREDIRPGLRLLGFRRRVTIALAVTDDTVSILGVFYGGQDVEAAMQEAEE
jgi:toxin ParE1/3/4